MASVVVNRELVEEIFSETKTKIVKCDSYCDKFFTEFDNLLVENTYGKSLNICLKDFKKTMRATVTKKSEAMWSDFETATTEIMNQIETEDTLR